MNSVSWFIYLADTLSNLQTWLMIASILISFVSAIVVIVYAIEEEKLFPHWWKLALTVFIFTLISILIPSRNTMYMIAASQVGEQIIQLEEVQEVGGEVGGLAKDAINLLRQNIQEQLTEKPTEAD